VRPGTRATLGRRCVHGRQPSAGCQLENSRALGRFPASSAAIAVTDPDDGHIGSGAATLHAVAPSLATSPLRSDLPTLCPIATTGPVVLMAYWDVGIFFAGLQGRDRQIPFRRKWLIVGWGCDHRGSRLHGKEARALATHAIPSGLTTAARSAATAMRWKCFHLFSPYHLSVFVCK
jgi:hypothetical protein